MIKTKSLNPMEILVAGGGTAGCAAAIAAARRGHKVLLLEEGNCLGGVSTAGGVNELYASLEGLGDIFDRVIAELRRYGALRDRFFFGEVLKIIWQLLADEAGVELLFHTSLVDVKQRDGHVEEVQAVSCSQFIDLQAKFFIDATGEGDLAALAGAEFMKGHPESGRTLHMTLVCHLADTGKPVEPYLPAGLEEIKGPEELPGLGGPRRMPDGRLYASMTKIMGEDPTDPASLSRAEREARRQLMRVLHYIQKSYPTYMPVYTGSRIGIREGRRIVGDHILTENEITSPEPHDFEDGIAVATAQIDFHSLTRPGHAGWRQRVEPYAIPLRCLTPKGLANVLVAGKCISGDQVAHSSYRMTPTCCAMGQAAGTAAALAVEAGARDIRQVDVCALRSELSRRGMQLDPRKHHAFTPELSPDPTRGA